MTGAPINVLLIEDDPGDARLVDVLLSESKPDRFQETLAPTLADAIARISETTFDVALLDLSLPDAFGLEALARLRAFSPMLPIVVLTGNDDEQLALNAMQQGAQDYLVKGHDNADLITRSIRYAIERARVEANLRRSEGQFRAVFEHAGLGIGLIDNDARLFSVNPALQLMLGEDPTRMDDRRLSNRIHPDDRETVARQWQELLEGKREFVSIEARYLSRNGTMMWGQTNFSLVQGASQQPLFTVGLVEDISARKELEDQLRLAGKVLEATTEGMYVTDSDAHFIHVNPAFTRITGYEPEEVLGRRPSMLSSGRHGQDFYAAMWASLLEHGYWGGEIWNRRKSGELFAEWLNISAVRNNVGTIDHFVAVFSDITERKQCEERLSHQAHHDPLTGLPNRALFTERLERAVLRAKRNHLTLAVLFLDLDHFKEINDTLGHLAGDTLLREVAERLHRTVRREDTVARLGGDEFTLLIEDISDFRDAATVARKVLRRFTTPFKLGRQSRKITTSIGISLYPGDGTTVETLLHHADEAMYTAKKQGRDAFRFASVDLSSEAFEHHAMEMALNHAVKHDELELYFQPIFAMTGPTVLAAEALLRWRHPEIGLMVPGQFLPLAIETGLILPVGRWVMSTAFAEAEAWRRAGNKDLRLCINIGEEELTNPFFLETLGRHLEAAGFPASLLDIDVPATFIRKADSLCTDVIGGIRRLGARVVLDDFSSDKAEISFVRHCKVDCLKISAQYTWAISAKTDGEKEIASLLALARQLSLTVVAKGIETTEQRDVLSRFGCDGAQGYLLGRPVPARELPEELRRHQSQEP